MNDVWVMLVVRGSVGVYAVPVKLSYVKALCDDGQGATQINSFLPDVCLEMTSGLDQWRGSNAESGQVLFLVSYVLRLNLFASHFEPLLGCYWLKQGTLDPISNKFFAESLFFDFNQSLFRLMILCWCYSHINMNLPLVRWFYLCLFGGYVTYLFVWILSFLIF